MLHVVLFLRLALLERAVPEFLVAHLVDGQDDEIPFGGVPVEERAEAVDGVRLYAKFHAGLYGELGRKTLARPCDGGEIALVVDVDRGLALEHLGAGGVAAVFVPVGAHAVVDVVGDADLVDAALDGEGAHVVERKHGVVGKLRVHVVIGEHGGSNRCGDSRHAAVANRLHRRVRAGGTAVAQGSSRSGVGL